jgi:hypothetical protein
MTRDLPLQGVRQTHEGWEVYSPIFQFPVHCGSAADAKRIAEAIEQQFHHLGMMDYSEVDAAIAQERALGDGQK